MTEVIWYFAMGKYTNRHFTRTYISHKGFRVINYSNTYGCRLRMTNNILHGMGGRLQAQSFFVSLNNIEVNDTSSVVCNVSRSNQYICTRAFDMNHGYYLYRKDSPIVSNAL